MRDEEGQERLQALRIQGTVGAITAWSLREFSRVTGHSISDVVRIALDDWVLSRPRYLRDLGVTPENFLEVRRRPAPVIHHPNAKSDRDPGGG